MAPSAASQLDGEPSARVDPLQMHRFGVGVEELVDRFAGAGGESVVVDDEHAAGREPREHHLELGLGRAVVVGVQPQESDLLRRVRRDRVLDQSRVGNVCTRVQFAADACPPNSIYGTATARTPLLDQPLTGNVYLRSSRHNLPDLVADLEGQIDIELSGRIDSAKTGGLRARFETIPDAPVTSFVLDMEGGKQGLLQNSRNLCKADKMATQRLKEAAEEIRNWRAYDYVLVNDDVESSAAALAAIITAERVRRIRMEERVLPILETFDC